MSAGLIKDVLRNLVVAGTATRFVQKLRATSRLSPHESIRRMRPARRDATGTEDERRGSQHQARGEHNLSKSLLSGRSRNEECSLGHLRPRQPDTDALPAASHVSCDGLRGTLLPSKSPRHESRSALHFVQKRNLLKTRDHRRSACSRRLPCWQVPKAGNPSGKHRGSRVEATWAHLAASAASHKYRAPCEDCRTPSAASSAPKSFAAQDLCRARRANQPQIPDIPRSGTKQRSGLPENSERNPADPCEGRPAGRRGDSHGS